MKTTLILMLAFVSANLSAQEVPSSYANDFKLILESAKKSFKGDQSGTEKVLSEADFDKEYTVKNKFQGASTSRLVTDKEGILTHHAQFRAGISKAEALLLMGKFIDQTKPLVPPKFKESENILMKYVNNRANTFTYDSDDFSEVSQNPVITIGVMEKSGVYYVDITIAAPAGF